MKEFITAAKDSLEREDDETVVTTLDGTEVEFYKHPTAAQQTIMMLIKPEDILDGDKSQFKMFMSLFFESCTPETGEHLRERLLSRKDPFGVEDLINIYIELMEEWSARPTKSPAASAKRQSGRGRSSTAPTRAKASTSSSSPRRATSR